MAAAVDLAAPEWAMVEALIREDWSPEQVSAVLSGRGDLHISHETIYQNIWADKKAGGDLFKHLRQSPKRAQAPQHLRLQGPTRGQANDR